MNPVPGSGARAQKAAFMPFRAGQADDLEFRDILNGAKEMK
jgi:hypothetical protein